MEAREPSILTCLNSEGQMNTGKKKRVLGKITKAALATHNSLGSQARKMLYQVTLIYELEKRELSVKRDQIINLLGKDGLDRMIKIEMVVEELIVVLLRTERKLTEVHKKWARSYVKLAEKETGLLINFSEERLGPEIVLVEPDKKMTGQILFAANRRSKK